MAQLEALRQLVGTFRDNIAQYQSASYDEANLRVDFVDKFFELLGWDVRNIQGFSEDYREVVREDKIRIEGKPKAPDYSFRVGGIRKFFVEAKKPAIDAKSDTSPAFQVRRYGYTAKVPLSILTNFAELAVYDTRIKPDKNDSASVGRVFYCTFEDYERQYEWLNSTFSKTAIQKGSFDKYLADSASKKGTSDIDSDFLAVISEWRKHLARDLAHNNKDLDAYTLNGVVQKLIDRIVFLRIAEDRGTEEYGILLSIAKGKNVFTSLKGTFYLENQKYNSDLFRNDDLLNNLSISDKTLAEIVGSMYYPDSPYEFSIMPIEMLGNIYERFLGGTIRLTDGRQVKIEEKPDVRKAGGVYYTPQYIVRHIIANSVGKLADGRTPSELSALKILDPACGSGSFLIGAYDYLLLQHLKYYLKPTQLEKAQKQGLIYALKENVYHLSIREKQRILSQSIFGVDIDPSAVEVTKLSLLLKLMENETVESKGELFKHSELKLLPDLSKNIRCGNTLIGEDYYDDKDSSLFGIDDLRHLNAFSWKQAFPEIIANGGFDCVIGNPPYYNVETLGVGSPVIEYIRRKYSLVWMDKSDILFYFLSKAIELSKSYVSMIVSNAFLFADKAQNLRSYIIDRAPPQWIVNFEKFRVFKDAAITTAMLCLKKGARPGYTNFISFSETDYSIERICELMNAAQSFGRIRLQRESVFALVDERTEEVNVAIDGSHAKLGDMLVVAEGMQTGANKVFLFDAKPSGIPEKYIRKRISGELINRYHIAKEIEYLLFVEDVADFDELPASVQSRLIENKTVLKSRADKKRRPKAPWWNYTFPLHIDYYDRKKLWCSYRARRNEFVFDDTQEYIGLTNMTVIFDTNPDLDLKYVLALLNSKVLTFRYRSIGKQTGSGIYEFFANGLEKLPIPFVDGPKQSKIVNLVDEIMLAYESLYSAESQHEKALFARKAVLLDREIDETVFALYGLSKENVSYILDQLPFDDA